VLALLSAAESVTEQIKNTSAVINSLVGVPLDITRQISGISKNL
jgi:hypothetical protein